MNEINLHHNPYPQEKRNDPRVWVVYSGMVVLLIILVLFGSRLPKVARSLGQGISEAEVVEALTDVHLETPGRTASLAIESGRVIDGKSIMGVLLLAASCGTTITISFDGAL